MVSVQEGIYKLGRLHQICPFTGVRDRGDDDQARLRRLAPTPSRQRRQQQARHKGGQVGGLADPLDGRESLSCPYITLENKNKHELSLSFIWRCTHFTERIIDFKKLHLSTNENHILQNTHLLTLIPNHTCRDQFSVWRCIYSLLD